MTVSDLEKTLKTIHKVFPQAFINQDWFFISLCILRKGFLKNALVHKFRAAPTASAPESSKN